MAKAWIYADVYFFTTSNLLYIKVNLLNSDSKVDTELEREGQACAVACKHKNMNFKNSNSGTCYFDTYFFK